jgi:hypothetical protein
MSDGVTPEEALKSSTAQSMDRAKQSGQVSEAAGASLVGSQMLSSQPRLDETEGRRIDKDCKLVDEDDGQ